MTTAAHDPLFNHVPNEKACARNTSVDNKRPWGLTPSQWVGLGLVLFFAVLTIQYGIKIHGSSRSAFMRWCGQIDALWQGQDIWLHHAYPNPPIMAMILSPFVWLPDRIGALLWFALKAVMALVAIRWTVRVLEKDGIVFPLWGKIAGLLLVLRPIEGDLVHGNVNLFILFLLAAAMVAFFQRRDLQAGMWLGLAIACKLTPVLFVPYLAWKRAWKTLAGCAAGLILFMVVVPGLSFGMSRNFAFLDSWTRQMVLPYLVEGEVTSEHQNQSLPGLAYRLLTHSASFSDRIGHDYFPRAYHNMVALNPQAVRIGVKLVMVCFGVCVVWCCRAPITGRRDWYLLAEFALITLGMLLFSERTWKHHCVTLLFPLAVLGFRMSMPGVASRERVRWGMVVALSALLIMSTSTGLFDRHDDVGKAMQVYGAYTWTFLLLAGSMVVLMRTKEARPQETQPGLKIAEESQVTYARMSVNTEPDTSGSGLPARSVNVVSGSMPKR